MGEAHMRTEAEMGGRQLLATESTPGLTGNHQQLGEAGTHCAFEPPEGANSGDTLI